MVQVGGFNHLDKYESQWEGISHLLWKKTCLKPPTRYIYIYNICICIYVYMYICICIYIYVYVYIYIHIHKTTQICLDTQHETKLHDMTCPHMSTNVMSSIFFIAPVFQATDSACRWPLRRCYPHWWRSARRGSTPRNSTPDPLTPVDPWGITKRFIGVEYT